MARGSGHELEHRRFCLNTRKYFSAVHIFQRGCGVSSLQIFKSHLDVSLGSLLWVSLLEQGLEQMDSEVPANLSQSVML